MNTPAIGMVQLTVIEQVGDGRVSIDEIAVIVAWEHDREMPYRAAKVLAETMVRRGLLVMEGHRYRVTSVGIDAMNAKHARLNAERASWCP